MNHPDDWSDEEMDAQLLDDICICVIAFSIVATVVLAISSYLS